MKHDLVEVEVESRSRESKSNSGGFSLVGGFNASRYATRKGLPTTIKPRSKH